MGTDVSKPVCLLNTIVQTTKAFLLDENLSDVRTVFAYQRGHGNDFSTYTYGPRRTQSRMAQVWD